ncbi:hypothetical protein cypCar_00037884 [Cyprinus carpio]|nr:hypothetical protein cypCar_00037884 [Cyprinus carpio]
MLLNNRNTSAVAADSDTPITLSAMQFSLVCQISVCLSLCFRQDDEVVLQCSAMVHKEQQKLCLAAEGFGNRLCFLESTSNSKNVPPDLSICTFVLEQSLSVRALQEMLANTEERAEGVSDASVHHLNLTSTKALNI